MTSASSIRIEDDETLPEPRVAIDVAEIGFFRGRPGPRRTVAGAPMTAPAPIFGLFLDPGGRPRRGLSVALVEAATKFFLGRPRPRFMGAPPASVTPNVGAAAVVRAAFAALPAPRGLL